MMPMAPRLFTSGDIARVIDEKVTRVRHILNTRRHIRPVGRAGIVRLYDASAITAVTEELRNREAATTAAI